MSPRQGEPEPVPDLMEALARSFDRCAHCGHPRAGHPHEKCPTGFKEKD